MVDYPRRYTIVIVTILALLLLAGSSIQALAQEMGTIQIANPQPEETVSGLVIVSGTIDFNDFDRYEIFLQSGDRLIWAASGFSPVMAGNLARLDTRTFVNGTYQMIIRQVHNDSQYTDVVGPTFTISNPDGAPVLYPEVEANYLYPAEGRALVRVRNCTGEEFQFDYGSPTGFRDSGQVSLPPKQDAAICPYADIALQPAEYRGTGKGGGQAQAVTYSFMAEAGKVYQIIYNGPGAGANQLYIGPIEGDEQAGTSASSGQAAEPARVAPPTPVSGAAPAVDTVTTAPTPAPTVALILPAPTAAAETAGKVQAVLPVTGEGQESRLPFIIAATALILFLVGGGLIAARRRGSVN